ncbi:MAG: hypothetical protein HXY34_01765 [Candidatus Thorarchaeota archaeon]|nr:hypothetical protein [Candidatus Thorarchaeota archaeon]
MSLPLFWVGLSAVALSFVLSMTHLTDRHRIKVGAKLLLGSGFAGVSFSLLLRGGDIWYAIDVKVLAIFTLYLVAVTLLNGKRLLEMTRECEACDYKMRWSKCPGFRSLVCRLVEGGFLYAKVRPERVPPTDEDPLS